MFERYTEDARQVLSRARREAQKFHHDHIGTEHILLGLIKVKTGVAADILSHRNIDLKHAKAEVQKLVVPGTPIDEDAIPALPRTTHAHELIDEGLVMLTGRGLAGLGMPEPELLAAAAQYALVRLVTQMVGRDEYPDA